MCSTRGSGVLSSAHYVLEMSVVYGVCDMCMCLARGRARGVGDEWVTGLGLGFTNSGGTWGKWYMCLLFLVAMVWVVWVVWVVLGESGWTAWARV